MFEAPSISAPSFESVRGIRSGTRTADETRKEVSVIISKGSPELVKLFIEQGRVHLPPGATFEELDGNSCRVSVMVSVMLSAVEIEDERKRLKDTMTQQLSSAYDVSGVVNEAA